MLLAGRMKRPARGFGCKADIIAASVSAFSRSFFRKKLLIKQSSSQTAPRIKKM